SFPHGSHDDCVDALSGARGRVTKLDHPPARWLSPHGRIPARSANATERRPIAGGYAIEQITSSAPPSTTPGTSPR
ncbi:MAG TPA: hypothetical protein VKE73_14815, partial [Myxococcota bacterium]|nr:hypothetical protein [Myxococcota bacterium]